MTHAAPLFSIVTVCRNAERSIGGAIESVIAQTGVGGEVEHLIVDGLSTDGTLREVAKYPHLRVVSERDAGIYDAMNKGIGLARGRYIGLLNADDWYESDALASVAAAFRGAPDAGIVHGDVRRWAGGRALDVVRPPAAGVASRRLVMAVNHPASFVVRELFTRFGPFDTSYRVFADYDWMSRVVSGGTQLCYVPKVLTNFRVGGVSTMRFEARERYRVFRANGAGVFAAWWTVAHACAAVQWNRWRQNA